MVGVREYHYDFMFFLNHLVVGHSVFIQNFGVDKTGFVTHKVVAERCNMGKQFGTGFFQQMTVFWWNAIPRFWHAKIEKELLRRSIGNILEEIVKYWILD